MVAAVVVAGVVLRFVTKSHMWLDEALTVDIARLPIRDIPAALRQDGHPPLFYVLLHGWISVFGQSDVAVRALSGLFAVVSLPLAWLAGRRVAGPRAGWAFVVLLSLSPFAIRYGTEARMYALVIALVLAGYLLVANALESPRPVLLVGIALVTGALLLTHYWALWFIAATVVVLAWRAWRDVAHRAATTRVLAAIVVGGLFLVPWLPSMLSQSAHTGTPWAAAVRPTTMVTDTLQDFGGGDFAEGLLLGWGLFLLFLFGLCAQAVDDHRLEFDLHTLPTVRREAIVVGLTLAIASAAGYATHTTFATRYAAVVLPLFVLVAAVGLLQIEVSVVARVAVVTVLVALGLIGGVHNAITDRTQAGQVADGVRAGAQPGDLVVVCPDQLGPSLHRLLPTDLEQVVYPTFGSPDRVDWRDYAARNARADPAAFADRVTSEARAKSSHSVWLVWSGSYKTFGGQCDALLQDLAQRLGGDDLVVQENGDAYFEHAALVRFAGSRPT